MILKHIIKLILCIILLSQISFADEVISDFKDKSLPVLNEELRKLRKENETLKTYIDTEIASIPSIGLGEAVSKDVDTIYHADTDGFVIMAGSQMTWTGLVSNNSDMSSATELLYLAVGAGTAASACMPVKKGKYWKIVSGGGEGYYHPPYPYWIPFGS